MAKLSVPLLVIVSLSFLGCSSSGGGARNRNTEPPNAADLAAPTLPDLASTPQAEDLATSSTPADLGASPSTDLLHAAPDLIGHTSSTGPVIDSLTVNAFELWNGESLVVTATVTAASALHSLTLTDGAGASYGNLSQIGTNQFERTLSWAQIDAASDLSFNGSAARTFVVTVTDVLGQSASGSGAIAFFCDSGKCQNGACTTPTATLGACTMTLDQLTTCTEICGRAGQTCKSLGCGGYTGTLVAPSCSSASDESGLTSTLDGSKMTCDSFFLAIATLGLGGVRCCCD